MEDLFIGLFCTGFEAPLAVFGGSLTALLEMDLSSEEGFH